MRKKTRLLPALLLGGLIAVVAGLEIIPARYNQIVRSLRSITGSWGDGHARFVDVSETAGLHYRWTIPGPRPLDILQTIGNGCAFLDYNNDGCLDILLVGYTLALYRGDGHGHFTDVTRQMGLERPSGHFLGCAVGDYDNDGYDDIYISGYRTGLFLHNDGGKKFTDVTQSAGLKPQPWGTSCAWGDIDGDGRLDLYVCNYVDYDPAKGPRSCLYPDGFRTACPPGEYPPLYGVLYHNEGGGRFRNVTAAWGAGTASGNALGAAFAAFDGSGRMGLAVANDSKPGDLFQNVGGRFRNIGAASGTAYVEDSVYAGMGLDWGDYDNDGRADLAVGAFALQAKPIFHNDGHGLFSERSAGLGYRDASFTYLTFGTKWLDYDNDGWLDLILTNGHIRNDQDQYRSGHGFLQPTLLFHNEKGQRLTDMSDQAGAALPRDILGRGVAVGDYDNDGRVDVLVVDSQGTPLLLHNESAPVGHWLALTLEGTQSNRDGYGAQVTITAGGLTQTRWCHTDGSYLSASDKRVQVGLGPSTVAAVQVRWPDGHVDTFPQVRSDSRYALREGDRLDSL